jgi:hypothetical protein
VKITAVYAFRTFKLIMEVNHADYWLLDMKGFSHNDKGKLSEIRDDINMFQTVKIDDVSGSAVWENGVDFDKEVLIKNSSNINFLLK